MPKYTFRLRGDDDAFADEEGVILADAEAAHQYGLDIVRQLMRHRELETRHWCLDVYDQYGGTVCEILFATVDGTLDRLAPEFRRTVEQASERLRQLRDARNSLMATRRETAALIARSRGKPYLVVVGGESIIR